MGLGWQATVQEGKGSSMIGFVNLTLSHLGTKTLSGVIASIRVYGHICGALSDS